METIKDGIRGEKERWFTQDETRLPGEETPERLPREEATALGTSHCTVEGQRLEETSAHGNGTYREHRSRVTRRQARAAAFGAAALTENALREEHGGDGDGDNKRNTAEDDFRAGRHRVHDHAHGAP